MNDRFDLHIITQHNSQVYCGYFRRLVFGNSLTFSHIPLCFSAKPPIFPRLFDPRVIAKPQVCIIAKLYFQFLSAQMWNSSCVYIFFLSLLNRQSVMFSADSSCVRKQYFDHVLVDLYCSISHQMNDFFVMNLLLNLDMTTVLLDIVLLNIISLNFL